MVSELNKGVKTN